MSINLTDVQTDLSYLLGEQTVPTSGIEDRTRFIQVALERAYRAYDFPMNKLTATVALVSGVATLPTTVLQDSVLDVREVVSGSANDHIYKQVDYTESDTPTQGSYTYWLDGYEGAYTLKTNENDATLTIRYSNAVPTLNASISSPFPSSMALARGALIYVRQSEDPQADISQEEALFQAELDEVISAYSRSRPRRRMVSLHEASKTYIGDLGTGE
jgi:Ca2+-binding RTX toxin-like protein